MCDLPASHFDGAARDMTSMVTKARQLPMLVDISCSPHNGCAFVLDMQLSHPLRRLQLNNALLGPRIRPKKTTSGFCRACFLIGSPLLSDGGL
jgi:hypothetical protein